MPKTARSQSRLTISSHNDHDDHTATVDSAAHATAVHHDHHTREEVTGTNPSLPLRPTPPARA
jgi:hypothetical protein